MNKCLKNKTESYNNEYFSLKANLFPNDVVTFHPKAKYGISSNELKPLSAKRNSIEQEIAQRLKYIFIVCNPIERNQHSVM